MAKSNYQRKLYAIYSDRDKSESVIRSLIEPLDLGIIVCDIENLFDHFSGDKHKIVIFDYRDRHLLAKYFSYYHQVSHSWETIVVNVPHRLHTEKLLELGTLKGLFYQQTENEELTHGLAEIQKGQNWLPRHVCSQLIHFYRHLFKNQTIKATLDLTAREIQILRSLQTGASNTQMAESLFISEFTVKSHLYQIFKKISVRNRTQAINWANHNLVS